jgi:TRAP transporter 4TM/12TM fusion protein
MEEKKNQDELSEEEKAKAQRIMAEYDRESNTREFTGTRGIIISVLLICFSLFAFWMNMFSTLPEQIRRTTFVAYVIFMAFLLFPIKKGRAKPDYIPWYDFVLGIIGAGAFLYYAVNFEKISSRAGSFTQLDMIVGAIGILILLEICRRVVGIPILVVVISFIAYAYFGNYFSGIFSHRGFSITRIITHLFYTTEGVIGTPLGVCSTFIVLFIMFGAFLERTGVGRFFIDIANSIAGSSVGGPAKVAVIASALQGTISGSSVANTVGSGSFTIPMMKRTGYKPEFAAAVEAAASTGGQIMPPIMGAAAFLMAEMTGFTYSRIVLAAILPAILYFTGVWLMVHFEAKKLGLKGLPKDQIPNFFKLMLYRGYLILPLFVLVFLLMSGATPSRSAVYAILSAIIVSMFSADTRMTPYTFFQALENGARSTIGVAIACSVAGIIVGVITLTGLGLKLATGLLAMSGGIMIVALFFTMIAAIILGMGVPTTANYVIMATITAPIVIKLGVPVLAAHMFVFYFGIVADITPPVALAAYAGSAIAHSDPLKTGLTATRLAITAFLVPYIFVMSPSLLLIDTTPVQVVIMTITALIGMIGISSGMEGHMMHKMPWWERIIAISAGLLLIIPGLTTDIMGITLILFVIAIQHLGEKRLKASQAEK